MNQVQGKWSTRCLVLMCFVLMGFCIAAPAFADANNCKPPPGVPDSAGSGMQGGIDDQPKGGDGSTLYEQYGWSGLGWHTCDLGEDGWITMPEAAKDPEAFLDTSFGSIMMNGASTLGAIMTQLSEWVSDPGTVLAPIDGSIVSIAAAVEKSVWSPWASVLVVGAGCSIAWWARQGNPRRAFRTIGAIFLAALSVAALGKTWQVGTGNLGSDGREITVGKPGAVALGQFFDSAASEVTGEVSKSLTGGANSNIAYGATLYDQVLVPLWLEGAVGPGAGDASTPDTLAHDLFRANTMSWDEVSSGQNPEDKQGDYVRVAKILDGKEEGPYSANPTQYQKLRGVAGGRSDVGFQALLTMVMIAIIRIPASILALMGLIVIRFVVMFIPIWALFAVIEKTRPTAITAGKMVFAAVYNATVFGIFGIVHTAVASAIITSPVPAGFTFSKLMLLIALTIVMWVVSKPFRSVTVPATGDALTGAGQNVGQNFSALRSFGSMFLANKIANRGLERRSDKKQEQEEDKQLVENANRPVPMEDGSHDAGGSGYTVEQVRRLPYPRRRGLEAGPRRELPPPPSTPMEQTPSGPTPPQLPPRPMTATVPVKIEHEVIEPTRMLEISPPEIHMSQPEHPVVQFLEQDESGQWQKQQWREVWQPPSDEPQKPVWEDRKRWRTPQPIWEPPQWEPQTWTPPQPPLDEESRS